MRKIRFVVPNFFTSVNFLRGVSAILLATGGLVPAETGIVVGAQLVLIGALADKLDGFAAKRLDARTEFGAQFDSLADLVAFGLAPAFIVFFAYRTWAYDWFATHKPMMCVSFSVYVLCAAMRLARYNAMDIAGVGHPGYFSGLPSTFAGAATALCVILGSHYGFFAYAGEQWLGTMLLALVLFGVLMVSPLYLSKLKRRRSRWLNALQIVLIVVVYVCGLSFWVPYGYIPIAAVAAGYFVIGFGHGLLHRDEILEEHRRLAEQAGAKNEE